MNTAVTKYVILIIAGLYACKKPPYQVDYNNIGGYVIGKQICNIDTAKDYWLVDFSVYPDSPQIGDTLDFNGRTYANVLKVKGLDPRLQHIGMAVSVDYKTISSSKVTTGNCDVTSPETYTLKELFIIDQGEIR